MKGAQTMSQITAKPLKEKVYLSQLQREVTLNFITIRDDEWMSNKFGSEKLATCMTGDGLDIDVIFSIFFRVLTKEDKESILKVKIHDEIDGELKEIIFNEPEQKLKAIVSGQKEITDIIIALTQSRIKSNPVIYEAIKKKALEKIQNNQEHSDGIKPKT
jgi:hypothetical protein